MSGKIVRLPSCKKKEICNQIKDSFDGSNGTYGSSRILGAWQLKPEQYKLQQSTL